MHVKRCPLQLASLEEQVKTPTECEKNKSHSQMLAAGAHGLVHTGNTAASAHRLVHTSNTAASAHRQHLHLSVV